MQDLHDGMGSQLISAMRVAEVGALSSADMKAVLRGCLDDLRLTVDSLEPSTPMCCFCWRRCATGWGRAWKLPA